MAKSPGRQPAQVMVTRKAWNAAMDKAFGELQQQMGGSSGAAIPLSTGGATQRGRASSKKAAGTAGAAGVGRVGRGGRKTPAAT